MIAATAVLLTSVLAACRISPSPRVSAYPERAPASQQTDGPDVRVRLITNAETITLDADGPLLVRSATGQSTPRTGPVTITKAANGFTVAPSTRTIPAQQLSISTPSGLITLGTGTDAVRLEGTIEIAARTDTSPAAFDVIENIPIERYLPGVLAKELYHDFLPAAYEAQAIAARSYALHERNRRRAIGSNFDLEASTVDQAYAGAGAHPKAEAAVKATAGQTLTYRGHVLRAYYSSTCGGRPASARDTWPITKGFEFNTDAPIQAQSRVCACTSSPKNRWQISRNTKDTEARLRAWGSRTGNPIRKLAALRTINIDARNPATRPNRYLITDSKGKRYTLSAEQLRLAFNTQLPNVKPPQRIWSGDLHITQQTDELAIKGRGFGHGVGLCQFGANGLAKQGLTAREILNRYYPGARITDGQISK